MSVWQSLARSSVRVCVSEPAVCVCVKEIERETVDVCVCVNVCNILSLSEVSEL